MPTTLLHTYLIGELAARLTPLARRRGIHVKAEATILGSHKPKDVDVAIMDPDNGPLMLIGVRSQMSSVGKNVLTYHEGIVGECISLQDRFPMSPIGYAYLHPLWPIKEGKSSNPSIIRDTRRCTPPSPGGPAAIIADDRRRVPSLVQHFASCHTRRHSAPFR